MRFVLIFGEKVLVFKRGKEAQRSEIRVIGIWLFVIGRNENPNLEGRDLYRIWMAMDPDLSSACRVKPGVTR